MRLEECESGRIGRSRKPLWSQGHRGFESHLLRQVVLIRELRPQTQPSTLMTARQRSRRRSHQMPPLPERVLTRDETQRFPSMVYPTFSVVVAVVQVF
jgi:hypothetical protein